MVLNYEVGMRTSEQLDTPTPNLRFSTVMEYEHAPLQNHHHQGHVAKSNHLVLHFNTLACPPTPLRHTVESVLGHAHQGVPTFRNPRLLAIFQDFLASVKEDAEKNRGRFPQRRMKVALLTAFCGLYRIYAVGRYEVAKSVRKTSVELLNGFLRIEERSKFDEHTVFMPIWD
jgi:hypothetical protein